MDRRNQNHPSAWAAFYLQHRRPLATYALSLVANEPDAEDLIQETLMRMVKINRPVKRALPYVFRSMRNLAIDRHRAAVARPVTSISEPDELAFIDPGLGDLARQESAQLIRSALQTLSKPQREVVTLKIYCDQTFREIAAVLDQPIGTVTSHYARALAQLRATFPKEATHA